MKEVTAMLKAIHAQEDADSARGKAAAMATIVVAVIIIAIIPFAFSFAVSFMPKIDITS